MNLNYRRKLKRRLPNREKETLLTPNGKNISWSMDFVSDVLTNGRRFRVLNIIDDFNREAVAISSQENQRRIVSLNALTEVTERAFLIHTFLTTSMRLGN